jgi:putative transcription factor
MSCEICGAEITGKGIKIRVEGTIMTVCRNCADLGEPVREPQQRSAYFRTSARQAPGGKVAPGSASAQTPMRAQRRTQASKPAKSSPARSDDNLVIVDGYADVIKKARGATSLDEFAKNLNEKASAIQKIESGKLRPTIKLAKKIERIYRVKLLKEFDKAADADADVSWKDDSQDRYVPSLGDFIKKKE